ncbi:zf-HC2 domain-containing protein [Actinoplanes sp. NPDC051411]|uniref:anti-sigma factor family protein n=1 Tax=Actinoplanes sp. NPDC051411 TaxID=3155522 RepID=UPI003434065D
MRCEHEHDDGAYVLGALSPAERVAYERHLATCSFCREAVRDISTLPDLLSRLDATEFAKLVDPSLSAGEEHHPIRRLVTRRKTAKNLTVRVLSSAAALLLIALVAVGVLVLTRGPSAPAATPPGPAVAMMPVAGASPLTATLRMTSKAGGTLINLTCSYSESATKPYTFRLIAYGPDDEKEQVGSWQAAPGTDFPMEAVTHFAAGSLSRLELVQYDGKALLAYDVP